MQIKFPATENPIQFSFKNFLWKEKERIFTVFAIVLIGAFTFAKSISGKEKRLADYFQSGVFQAKLKAGKEISEKDVKLLIKKHSELRPLFASHLQQSYILKNELIEARKIAEDSLKRISFIPNNYIEFAKNSLLIEEGKDSEALLSAKQLKDKLHNEMSSNLYGLNLVRIAFLEDRIQNDAISKTKWSEIKNSISNELYLHLSDENVSFLGR